jgi:hypothetical protein
MLDELLGLNSGCLSEDVGDCILDGRALVIEMDEDIVDRVLIKACAPRVWEFLEEDLEDLAGFDSDSILGIVKTLE